MKDILNRKKIIAVIIFLIMIIAIVLVVILNLGGERVSGSLKVPVNIIGADNVGSFEIYLKYDPSILTVVDLKNDRLTENSLFEYNLKIEGLIIIGIVDSTGIKGDGSIAQIGFDVNDSSSVSHFNFQSVETYDAISLTDILYETIDGQYDPRSEDLIPPTIKLIR